MVMDSRQSRKSANTAMKTDAVLWPKEGANIRIWSLLSRKNDGFLQVKEKIAKDVFSVDGTGTYDSNSIFRFYAFNDPNITVPEYELSVEVPDDSTSAWIGIPGNRIGKDADRNNIYMLQWTEDGGMQAKGFKAPEDYRKRPDISDSVERKQATFLVSFKSSTNYLNLQWSPSGNSFDSRGKSSGL
ncbi:uncharacterized protein [Ptychodera flava]|uniref:uncharacterized protein n=1 Tax=Ptychodera flava TaxID=63121 RepID=UPI003969F792